ncbi:Asp-tRNA(Asn)/Glu-tRNA(Gln) amidotransferase subunit GatC [Patescibacteria group bacterium]|nr:Asp-tRNA(Asn)/Glu-tRNA(Gln) amidotransferase subunit GatC [Patescibacteria group bacterium]
MIRKNSKLSEKEVKHVAKLAKLGLTPSEVKKFQEQLSEVLAYMEILKEVKTEKTEPTSQVTSLENVFREDKAKTSLSQKEVLSGAKQNYQSFFKIKRILKNS